MNEDTKVRLEVLDMRRHARERARREKVYEKQLKDSRGGKGKA